LKQPQIIAHRGASGYRPENTLAAFSLALEMGVDGLELDVQMTRDGHIIVCHDEQVDRTTNGSGWIKDMTLEEIKALDAGSWFNKAYQGEKIPTLREVLDLVKGLPLLMNIELKNGPIQYPGLEEKTIAQLKEFQMEKLAILSSFNHYSLLEVKKVDPQIKTGILYMAGLVDPWVYARYVGAQSIHPYLYSVVPSMVKGAIENHFTVYPFTVNEEIHMKHLFHMGVTGMITNYPDRARKLLEG